MAARFLQEQMLSPFLNALDVGVIIIDRPGVVVWVNEKICRLTGLARAELIGLTTKELAVQPAIETQVVPEWVNDAFWEQTVRLRPGKEAIRPSYGYARMRNGAQLLSTEDYIYDEEERLRYIVLTVHASTDLLAAQAKINELEQRTALYQEQLSALHTRVLGHDVVYHSESLRRVFARALRLARLDGNIFLTGETGVGKNLLAHYIHAMSRRASGPFIHVNCASLPASLIEAELFGYTEGAFTGAARKGRRGVIEMGQGGTVFLDEIGEMPVEMQAKLLTVLEDKEIRRLGSERAVSVNVRFLAATNKNPDALLQAQTLRNDLYYRLAMNRIDLPPLREHPEDIPALIAATLAEFNDKHGSALTLHRELVERIQTLPFPGNVRELKNLVWQIASESGKEEGEITAQMLPPELTWAIFGPGRSPLAHSLIPSRLSLPSQKGAPGEEEERLWRTFCEQHHGDVYAMANALGVHRTTVIRQLKKYGLSYARKPRARLTPLKTTALAGR
ncbi:MAG TPA: sigma 54-interacting transcriptional regulator [Methylomirabilota bacterium]|nr:sigma 54-interacting transcriptional regulator [Methylomirabilota bacterium]